MIAYKAMVKFPLWYMNGYKAILFPTGICLVIKPYKIFPLVYDWL